MAQVKAGYKQTDIGVIPEDWDAPFMGDLAQIQRGASPRPISSPIWFDNKSSVGWLRISDVSKSKKHLKETTQHLSEAGIANSRYVAEQNLVMSICATVGRPIITHKNLCIHDGFVVFDQIKADKEYMYYALSNIENDWAKCGQTGSQMNLNTGLINNTRIPLPQPEEQKQIAAALSDVDGLIESLENLITKKRDMKTAAMQQLLTGKKRLPGFDGEWEELTLGDVCSEINDGTHYTPTYVSEGVPFYSVENVTANDFTNVKYITQEEHNLLIKRCRPEKGDILLTRIGSIGDTRLIDWDVDASIYVSLALLKTNQKAESAYVYEYTKSSFFIKDIEARSLLNATPKKINMGDIKGVPIKCPKSRDEQLTIAKILSDMRAEINALEQRLEKARNLKMGMMQELLTGKTRFIKTDKKQEAT